MITLFVRRAEGKGDWSTSGKMLSQQVNYRDSSEAAAVQSSIELPSGFSINKILQRYSGILVSLGHLASDLLLDKQLQSLVFSKDVCESYLDDVSWQDVAEGKTEMYAITDWNFHHFERQQVLLTSMQNLILK